MNRHELFEKINNQILAKLEEGVIPWKKSWKSGVPLNFVSKRPYHGINFLTLSIKDYASPYYLTFLQAKEKGGSIISGSKSQMVLYWKVLEYENEEQDIRKYPFLRYSNVFNVTQTSLYVNKQEDKLRLFECEAFLARMKEKPIIKHNFSRCYYSPAEDYISLPKIDDFDSMEEYYSSLFHELIHWTAKDGRTGRIKSPDYGEEEYSFEELVAELGSSYLSALCGIFPSVVENQSAYIQGWLRLSKEKENVFPRAASAAQRGVNYILGYHN